MRELSQHLMDLIENSVEAGCRRVAIQIDEDMEADLLTIRVEDDGRGMSSETVSKAIDPFWTTRSCRKVGLGLPLIAATAKRCAGSLRIESIPARGTTVTAVFRHSHIDRPPLGDLHSTLVTALVAHSGLDILYRHHVGQRSFELDGAAIRRELEGIPLTHPSVLQWIDRYISEGLAEVGASAPFKEKTDAKAE
jgi:anti-sigma regulatory factor (Ser/Thr protein kinase)